MKSTSYAVNMAAQREARRRGADDALFLSLEGLVLEGPTSNIWFREGRTLHTPALDLGILAGVTRDTLIGAAAAPATRLPRVRTRSTGWPWRLRCSARAASAR